MPFKRFMPLFPEQSPIKEWRDSSSSVSAQLVQSSVTALIDCFCGTLACDTTVTVSMAFGGKSWTIDPADMNIGPAPDVPDMCGGGIFDIGQSLGAGPNLPNSNANPSWVVGDVFLVRFHNPTYPLECQLMTSYRGMCTPFSARIRSP